MTVTVMPESSPTWDPGYNVYGYISQSSDPLASFNGTSCAIEGWASGGSGEHRNSAYLIYRYRLDFPSEVSMNSIAVTGSGDWVTGGSNGGAALRLLGSSQGELVVLPTYSTNLLLKTLTLNAGGVRGLTFYLDEFDYSTNGRYRSSIHVDYTSTSMAVPEGSNLIVMSLGTIFGTALFLRYRWKSVINT